LDKVKIWEKAREYLGTPFHDHGRIKGRGVDCVGIILCVGEDLGLQYKDGSRIRRSDYLDYGRFPILDEMQTEASQIFVVKSASVPLDLSVMAPGDILTMRGPFLVHHMAIVTPMIGALGIIHTYRANRHGTVEHILDPTWQRRIAGIFSYSGVDG
jgi:cell wall-associated NlpC family hydrolase